MEKSLLRNQNPKKPHLQVPWMNMEGGIRKAVSMEFSQEMNLQIVREFTKEGIRFAFPTSTTYLTQDDGDHLNVSIVGTSQPTG